MDWKTLLACITGSVEEHILLRNEYLAAENTIFRNQITGRLHLSDTERITLAEIGRKLGKQALAEVAKAAKPDTILGWHRKLVAQKFDGSDQRKALGRPRISKEVEDLVVEMAKANRSWGYDRLAGVLAHLGHEISDQTVGNILKRRGLPTAPERQKTTTWKEFLRHEVVAVTVVRRQKRGHNPLFHQRYPKEMCSKGTTWTEPPDHVPTVYDWHRNREATMYLSAPRRRRG